MPWNCAQSSEYGGLFIFLYQVIDVDEEEKEEVVNVTEVLESVDPKKVEIADNIVLRKLLVSPSICSWTDVFMRHEFRMEVL